MTEDHTLDLKVIPNTYNFTRRCMTNENKVF